MSPNTTCPLTRFVLAPEVVMADPAAFAAFYHDFRELVNAEVRRRGVSGTVFLHLGSNAEDLPNAYYSERLLDPNNETRQSLQRAWQGGASIPRVLASYVRNWLRDRQRAHSPTASARDRVERALVAAVKRRLLVRVGRAEVAPLARGIVFRFPGSVTGLLDSFENLRDRVRECPSLLAAVPRLCRDGGATLGLLVNGLGELHQAGCAAFYASEFWEVLQARLFYQRTHHFDPEIPIDVPAPEEAFPEDRVEYDPAALQAWMLGQLSQVSGRSDFKARLAQAFEHAWTHLLETGEWLSCRELAVAMEIGHESANNYLHQLRALIARYREEQT